MSGREIKLLTKFVRKQSLTREKNKPKGLDSFFIENPFRYKVRKIMTRFLQGIGATLLAIVIGFGGVKGVGKLIDYGKFEMNHYITRRICWNCDKYVWCSIEKGTKAAGTEHRCSICGMTIKIPEE